MLTLQKDMGKKLGISIVVGVSVLCILTNFSLNHGTSDTIALLEAEEYPADSPMNSLLGSDSGSQNQPVGSVTIPGSPPLVAQEPTHPLTFKAIQTANDAVNQLRKAEDIHSKNVVKLDDTKENIHSDLKKYQHELKVSRVGLWKVMGSLESELASFKRRVVRAKGLMMSRDNYLSNRVAALEDALARAKTALRRHLTGVRVRMEVVSQMTGPAGHPGRDGADGAAGPEGYRGPRGLSGPPGVQGPPGPRGWDGRDGMPGVMGSPGDMGIPGPPGPRGAQGRAGIPGPSGEPGPQGVGETGVQGPAGPMGGSGVPGQVGAPGPMGMSIPGMWGASGPSGVSGSPGMYGVPGAGGAPAAPRRR